MTTKVIQADREAAAAFFQAGSWPDLALAFASHADPLRRALEEVMVGGNHLACILVRRLGADFAERFPPETEPEDALRVLCATDEYDVWCCWRAIMLARAALSSGENNNGE